jgi:hypothetical protein
VRPGRCLRPVGRRPAGDCRLRTPAPGQLQCLSGRSLLCATSRRVTLR